MPEETKSKTAFQTAIDILKERQKQVPTLPTWEEVFGILDICKDIEKQQIAVAYLKGSIDGPQKLFAGIKSSGTEGDDYYEEKYGA